MRRKKKQSQSEWLVNKAVTRSDPLINQYYYTLKFGSNTTFYPVSFLTANYWNICINSQGGSSAAAYNMNVLRVEGWECGWSDTPNRINVRLHGMFSSSEVTIHSIYTGNENGNIVLYLRGGLTYFVNSNILLTARESALTSGNEYFPTFTSGTPAVKTATRAWIYTQGATSQVGPQGTKGTQGIRGTQGTKGATGSTGAQGIRGTQGTKGSTGSTGAQGTRGTQGTKGSTGSTGAQGIRGTTGTQGTAGSKGAQGIRGTTGTQGTRGTQGTAGSKGAQGTAGSNASVTWSTITSLFSQHGITLGEGTVSAKNGFFQQ